MFHTRIKLACILVWARAYTLTNYMQCRSMMCRGAYFPGSLPVVSLARPSHVVAFVVVLQIKQVGTITISTQERALLSLQPPTLFESKALCHTLKFHSRGCAICNNSSGRRWDFTRANKCTVPWTEFWDVSMGMFTASHEWRPNM